MKKFMQALAIILGVDTARNSVSEDVILSELEREYRLNTLQIKILKDISTFGRY